MIEKRFNSVKKTLIALIMLASLAGCTSFQVTHLDTATGYFPTTSKAKVIESKKVNLDEVKGLLVFEGSHNTTGSKFILEMAKNIGYFDKVITTEDLESEIIIANLTDKIPSLDSFIGMSNAAKYYKKFLWLYVQAGTGGTAQLVLANPLTTEKYLVIEQPLGNIWVGRNDQNTWYPLMNGLVEYIKENSKIYATSKSGNGV